MRSRVRFPVLPWGFFLEGEDSHGDHGLGSLVELTLRPLLVLQIHISPSTSSGQLRLMGVPTSEVGYTSATTGRGDHEVHKGHVVGGGPKVIYKTHLQVRFSTGSDDDDNDNHFNFKCLLLLNQHWKM
jgi:hypothetical protein